RDDIRIVLEVVRENGANHLRLVAVRVMEQRTDRTVDEARGQHLLLRRTAFTLEEAARDLAGGESLFLIVDGQREKIDAGFGRLGAHGGAEDGGLTVGREDRAVGLTRDLSGFEDQLAAAP